MTQREVTAAGAGWRQTRVLPISEEQNQSLSAPARQQRPPEAAEFHRFASV